MKIILAVLLIAPLLSSCTPLAWLARGAMGRAALTRAATVEGVASFATTSAFARSAASSGLSATEGLAIRGAAASLLRSSPLRLSTARSVPVTIYHGERLVLRGVLERNGNRVVLKDPTGAAVRVEAQSESRAQFWDVAGDYAGEALLEVASSQIRAVNGQLLGRDVLNRSEIAHFDADGRLLGTSRIMLDNGQSQLRLELSPEFSGVLSGDLAREQNAPLTRASTEPGKREISQHTVFVAGNLTHRLLPRLNGFNAEASSEFVASILQHGGPSWASQRTLLKIAALESNGDCRDAVSVAGAKVCSVEIAYRAPGRPSFHLREECPGATEGQAVESCLTRMQNELRTRLTGADSAARGADRG